MFIRLYLYTYDSKCKIYVSTLYSFILAKNVSIWLVVRDNSLFTCAVSIVVLLLPLLTNLGGDVDVLHGDVLPVHLPPDHPLCVPGLRFLLPSSWRLAPNLHRLLGPGETILGFIIMGILLLML